MKLTTFVIVLCFCLPLFGEDQPQPASDVPATKEQIEKLFDIMDIRQQTRLTMDSMQQQMHVLTAETIHTRYPEITRAQMARLTQISDETLKDFPVDAMLEDMVPIYQKHLSQVDVDAMIVFYSSPTGKKLMQQLPQITQEAVQASYQRMQKQIDAALQRVEDMVKEEQQNKPKSDSVPQSKQN